MRPYRHEQNFSAVRAVYGRQPSSQARLEPSVSALHCIDLAFIGHEATLVRKSAGPVFARKIPAGTGGMHGGEPLEFVQVDGQKVLANLTHRSSYHFMRTFTLTTGMRPHQYVKAIRMERAREALLQGNSVKATAIAVGYAPGHSFRKAFYQYFGVRPSQWTIQIGS